MQDVICIGNIGPTTVGTGGDANVMSRTRSQSQSRLAKNVSISFRLRVIRSRSLLLTDGPDPPATRSDSH